ncbi:uncharacterized protein LOC118241455, partial [Electrophorus electricus]|uniref:uncharacterized protein LOC118241455 n=1 Tax=Electrophorus electricus TaxID=8005 RepID=UPI0015D02E57
MDNISKLLLDILEELKIEDLKKFQWHLTNSVEDDKRIPKFQLENTDRLDTVDNMVQKYDPDGAVMITLDILKKMNYNRLAETLRIKHSENKAEAAVGGQTGPGQNITAQTGPCQNITAQTGGAVSAPVLHGKVFQGPVTFFTGHYKPYGGDKCEVSTAKSPAAGTPLTGNMDIDHLLTHHECFIPEVIEKGSEVKGSNSYRFMCPHAGQFQCKLTNLVFEMEGKGEVMYRIVSWDTHPMEGLAHMQPIGPLYDINSIQGSVSHLHLPHCEIMYEESKAHLAVAHFTADSVELIQPVQVTNTHVILDIQGFSLFGLLFNKLFGSSCINAQVLLLYKEMTDRQRRKKLQIHLLPGNVSVDEVMNRQIDFRNIITSSKCQLVPGEKYRPMCEHNFQPPDETFDRDYGPN